MALTTCSRCSELRAPVAAIVGEAPHHYHGGRYDKLPARIVVPDDDYWNVTLDLGGGNASIRHSIGILKAA